ncbi:MAG: Fis family transcriptional regulator [Burkholderiales bacterium RIFCSPLOWO2_12_FULL_61_40]|nr:MAG: Fis family transcriptional regulator [Burkholderiales bacterium RIFCSPLOWO2_12_FULL_61_40]
MANKQWLISWIGNADHIASEDPSGSGSGPIATALLGGVRYDRICLLTNYGHERGVTFCAWLEKKCGYLDSAVDLQEIDLLSPIHYASIYNEVSKHLKNLGLPHDDVELTFHLSPGTPAMVAIWIMLAKTRFPAKLIQTSQKGGLESVDFPFDLANDFLPEFLQRSGERIDRLIQGPTETAPHFSKIVHRSESVKKQIHLAQRIALHDVPVLILGETGTGKELFAEAIRASSERADKPFITVNCGAIAPELANSELFGHVKGAFTGAASHRKGHFQEAHGGTLFLDEVGDLPLETQVRLLRALQVKEVTPLGDSKPIKVDVRVIAATHRDLAADVATGHFREDLFHRLAVGILRLPPLREREGDIDLLVDTFLNQINADARGKPEAQDKRLSIDARKILIAYAWPGNIRELYHSLLRAAIWSTGAEIQSDDVRSSLLQIQRLSDNVMGRPLSQGFDLQELLDEISRDYVNRALKQTADRRTLAAKLLGFANHQTLGNWIKRLGLVDRQLDS